MNFPYFQRNWNDYTPTNSNSSTNRESKNITSQKYSSTPKSLSTPQKVTLCSCFYSSLAIRRYAPPFNGSRSFEPIHLYAHTYTARLSRLWLITRSPFDGAQPRGRCFPGNCRGSSPPRRDTFPDLFCHHRGGARSSEAQRDSVKEVYAAAAVVVLTRL